MNGAYGQHPRPHCDDGSSDTLDAEHVTGSTRLRPRVDERTVARGAPSVAPDVGERQPWSRIYRKRHEMPLVQVTDSPTETLDAADLLRLDDDGGMGFETGGRHAPGRGVGGAGWGIPRGTIPGEREPGPQTRFGGPSTSIRILSDWPMAAATIADRRREGGGAPSQRRRASAESGWRRMWRRFIDLRRQRRVVEGQAGDAL